MYFFDIEMCAGQRPRRGRCLVKHTWGDFDWKPKAVCKKLEARNWRPEAGGQRPEARGWRLEARGWRPEAGGWRPEAGGQRPEAGG